MAENSSGVKSSRLFLTLSWSAFTIFVGLIAFLNYLIYPRLYSLSSFLPKVFILFSLVLVFTIGGGLALLTLTSVTGKDFLWPHGKKQITIRVLFPIVVFLGEVLGVRASLIRESYVHLNNSMMLATKKRIKTSRVLILLPHCVQFSECPVKITYDINKCKECGRCIIGDVVKFARKYNVKVSVATGGTLARRVVVQTKPDFIIAVACDRDLTSGINDVYPIPVYGILNIRKYGPCFNTTFDIKELQRVYSLFVNGKKEVVRGKVQMLHQYG